MAAPKAGAPGVRVLICDDSPTFAAGLKLFLEHDAEIRVVARTGSGEEAIREVARLRPDLVTMDLELPGIDGVEATRRILAERLVPIVVLSSHTPRGSERAAAALAAGAIDVLAKDHVRLDAPSDAAAVALRLRIKRLARNRPRPPGASTQRSAGAVPITHLRRGARVVAIGASTGGPQALLAVLSALPRDYRLPVLVVQHMTAGFTAGLVRWLDQQVPLRVSLAEDGAPLRGGVCIAPDGAHLVLDHSMRLRLDVTTEAGPHRPAVNMLLEAVARVAGRGGVGVVLTGMGRDGADGIAAIRAAGGLTIAQDESTSVVWGMPRAAAEQGAELVLPLQGIGPVLGSLATGATGR